MTSSLIICADFHLPLSRYFLVLMAVNQSALRSFKRVKSSKVFFFFLQIMWFRLLIISLWTCSSLTSSKSSTTSKEEENLIKSHHRQKRFLWMTQEKRLVLPPGTQLVLTPTLAMPLLRYPPSGLDANLTISTPFTRNDFSFIHKNCS